jgi:hypothetical protein
LAVLKANGIPLILKAMKNNFDSNSDNKSGKAKSVSSNDKMASTNPEPVL